ncbi:glycoside hydrolase TIM-barrel-like domain-containing protein [Roseovarius sp. SYSU LYC5161]|uniref:baseplate multidomain protein megatron n=1 Tax=Roseovarius halophilus (ex Wu et al. 2025) TaxID=3376060 RepID=UPI00399B9B09
MVTAVFAAAGGALGSIAGSAIGGSILGVSSTLIGGSIGQLLGATAARAITAGSQTIETGRLTNTLAMDSQEGTPIRRGWGRFRVGGTMIWWANFDETVTVTEQGGKDLGGGVTRREYSYSLSFAVGLCEGPVDQIGRIWVDGQQLDETSVTVRRYLGTESQQPDPTIEAIDGGGNAPGYLGLAYLVFEDMDLSVYGNRPPQVSAEIVRSVDPMPVQGACLIPGSTEVGYDTVERKDRRSLPGPGNPDSWKALNVHQEEGRADVLVSLDSMEAALPNVQTVLVVVGWFFDDLRISETVIEPRFENVEKNPEDPWSVSGFTRATANEVSAIDGNPSYGSSPDDRSVLRLLKELKQRGFNVIVYPFLFGDVPPSNTLPDPYSDAASTSGQPVFPWRGRMTLSVAPGYSGSPDQTAAAAAEVSAFFGSAGPSDFGAWDGNTIPYSGPGDGGLRRMILHYAAIAAEAGLGAGDAIAIGSEMVQLNAIRSDKATFPAVSEWKALAADVRGVLPADVEITYASDWSETTFFQAGDGSGDLFFHLDPLWADDNIDFIGIDNYLPLADINPGTADQSGREDQQWLQYDLEYLKGNVEGGELWDYFYASQEDRQRRDRTPIVDTAHGKDWVFRRKALRDWWLNQHYDRPGGAESSTQTDWVPQSKRIVFTEYGFPAVDLGANQPNVFYDPKSSESQLPYFSSGAQDEAAQQQAIRALIGYWQENMPIGDDGAPMIDLSMCCAWAWDARPFPAFPALDSLWVDASNYHLGHWLNGRGGLTIGRLLKAVADGFNVDLTPDADHASVSGFVVESVTSYRNAVSEIFDAWAVDLIDTGVELRAVARIFQQPSATISVDRFATVGEGEARFERERSRADDVPAAWQISFPSADSATYETASVSDVQPFGGEGTAVMNMPVVMGEAQAFLVAERLLRESRVERESLGGLALPPSLMRLQAGDMIRVPDAGSDDIWQITQTTGGAIREFSARRIEPSVLRFSRPRAISSAARESVQAASGSPTSSFIPLDLPTLPGDFADHQGYAAVFSSPWPGAMNILRSSSKASGYSVVGTARRPATIGATLTDLPAGPPDRWNEVTLRVQLADGRLGSRTRLEVLGGANGLALETPDGWEIMQFRDATLVSPGVYDLSGLIRGRLGTERFIQNMLPAGAGFVYLDEAVVPITMDLSDVGVSYWWKVAMQSGAQEDTIAPLRHTFTGEGLRPWAPAHVSGDRDDDGNLTISWMRRSRSGTSWGVAQAPLAEDVERYEIDILDGENVVRTIETGSETAQYGVSEQTTDFGSPQASVNVVIYQIGSAYGRGSGEAATL